MVSTNFLAQKTIGKKKRISQLFVSRNVFKKGDFVNFLLQKFITKYGIVSTYSVTFVSQKILTCLQCKPGASYGGPAGDTHRSLIHESHHPHLPWVSLTGTCVGKILHSIALNDNFCTGTCRFYRYSAA